MRSSLKRICEDGCRRFWASHGLTLTRLSRRQIAAREGKRLFSIVTVHQTHCGGLGKDGYTVDGPGDGSDTKWLIM